MTPPPSDERMPPLPHPGGRGCLQIITFLVGVLMLLPGLCAILLAGLDPHEMLVDSAWLLLILGMLAIGAGGVALIWWAVKRPRQ